MLAGLTPLAFAGRPTHGEKKGPQPAPADDAVLEVELDEGDRRRVPPHPRPGGRITRQGCRRWGLAAVGFALLLGLVAAYWLFGSPKARGRLHFVRGVALQTAGEYDEAIEQFRKAMQLDPTLAPAAVRLGLAILHLGSPVPDAAHMRHMVESAMHGDVAVLERADEAFKQAVEMAHRARSGRRFPDAAQPDVRHVLGNAHACLALTRVLRASAAIGAGKGDQAVAWLREANYEVSKAKEHDRGNVLADVVQALAELARAYALAVEMGL